MKKIVIKDFTISNEDPLILMAGPCVIENRHQALEVAGYLTEMAKELHVPFIYKTSFDKANRTSGAGFRGPSLEEAIEIFQEIRDQFGCPIMTDVHTEAQCFLLRDVVDVLQIPALLCRQTDLLKAAVETNKVINIKKGQFLSPLEMVQVLKKTLGFNAHADVMLCERGSCFGYNLLVNDMRGLPQLSQTGYPVIFDATHSVQRPGALGECSGGDRQYVETLARAAVAVGIAGVFMETHPCPEKASSDGPNMVPLESIKEVVTSLKKFDALAKKTPYASFSIQAGYQK